MKKSKPVTGRFVHVVAKVNLQRRTGEILYVNPASVALETSADGGSAVELRFTRRDGTEIVRINPVLHIASCEAGATQRTALIQEDVLYAEGMSGIDLVIDGKTVHAWAAAAPAAAPFVSAVSGKLMTTKLQGMSPLEGVKIEVNADADTGAAELAGVTYTVQARPSASSPWSTLAVGSRTPRVTVDANQFPGRSSVMVRVLKTNGFSEDVIAEDTVKF